MQKTLRLLQEDFEKYLKCDPFWKSCVLLNWHFLSHFLGACIFFLVFFRFSCWIGVIERVEKAEDSLTHNLYDWHFSIPFHVKVVRLRNLLWKFFFSKTLKIWYKIMPNYKIFTKPFQTKPVHSRTFGKWGEDLLEKSPSTHEIFP